MRSLFIILTFVFTQNNVLSIMNNGTQNYSTGLTTIFYELIFVFYLILNNIFILSTTLLYL